MVCCCSLAIFGLGTIAALYLLKRYIVRGSYTKPTTINDKVVIITGANAGIGKACAIDLAKRGGKIYIACRNKTRGEDALNDIRRESGSDKVYFLQLDLASLKSVREFSEKFHQLETKLDILINNAGLLLDKKSYTEDGFEMHMGVNHLGHFLLTNLLLDLLKAAAPSRIVVVSSVIYKMLKFDKDDWMCDRKFSAFRGYGFSKIANILFTTELSKKLEGTGVTVNCCHPGAVHTDIVQGWNIPFMGFLRSVLGRFIKTPVEGAQTQIRLAVDPDLELVTGKYFTDCKEEELTREGKNTENAKWLWEKSCEVVSIKNTNWQ
ncbi:retinol dehydrogenase 12-like [Chironomus tepperi]|uniref:retinol dehydrogenase 12-like n=1 Tax=Chironomus tepperi TaxID=113505 RepID=UPI00391F46C9